MNDFMASLTTWTGQLADLLWGNTLILVVLLGMGLYLTIRMGATQLFGCG
jgi:Na+/alanine symporter